MRLAFKYRFYPTSEQEQTLAQTFGCVRYVYKFGLALRRDAYDKRGESLRYKDTSAALTGLKKQQETRWLREVSCVPLQQTLRHLDKAFTSFFEKRTDWQKQKRRVGRIHARIADKRRDFLHKLSTRLIQEHGLICLETLNVKGMMHNGCLARHIGQSGWSEFVSQLEYKAQLYGREVVHIDQWFPSSKQCSNCKHQVKELPLSVREWTCEACGTRHDRDVNAALNILGAGQALSACGENVRPALVCRPPIGGGASAGGLGEAGILAL